MHKKGPNRLSEIERPSCHLCRLSLLLGPPFSRLHVYYIYKYVCMYFIYVYTSFPNISIHKRNHFFQDFKPILSICWIYVKFRLVSIHGDSGCEGFRLIHGYPKCRRGNPQNVSLERCTSLRFFHYMHMHMCVCVHAPNTHAPNTHAHGRGHKCRHMRSLPMLTWAQRIRKEEEERGIL